MHSPLPHISGAAYTGFHGNYPTKMTICGAVYMRKGVVLSTSVNNRLFNGQLTYVYHVKSNLEIQIQKKWAEWVIACRTGIKYSMRMWKSDPNHNLCAEASKLKLGVLITKTNDGSLSLNLDPQHSKKTPTHQLCM